MFEKMPEKKPEIFNTISPHLRGHFESYNEEPKFENGEPEYDEVREEIARYYGVPFTTEEDDENSNKENHIFIIDNKIVKKQRDHRAFCVIRRNENGKVSSWYIDGRVGHSTMLQRLYNYYHVPEDYDHNEISLGFLDYDGFRDIAAVQKRSQEIKRPITWFLKETTSPDRGKELILDLIQK